MFGVEKTQHDFFKKLLKNENIIKDAKHQVHLGKFINTFSKEGNIWKGQLIKDNAEFFQNELKEFFIQEVVLLVEKLDLDSHIMKVDSTTKIVKNDLFELTSKNKVIPKFTNS